MNSSKHVKHILAPAVSHIEPKTRVSDLAPVAYACIWRKPDGSLEHLTGYCWDKTPSATLARCNSLAFEEVLKDDPDAQIDIIREQTGFVTKQEEILFKQLSAGTFAADGHGAYRRMTELGALVNLVERKPATAEEGELINSAQELAKAIRPEALADFLENARLSAMPCIRAQRRGLPLTAV